MKITYIGQAGLILENHGTTVMIDPYLSDSCAKLNPNSYRRQPVDETLFDLHPDILIFTHNHIDHYDPETAPRFLARGESTVLCPTSVWAEVRKLKTACNNVEFNPHTVWTQGGFRFTAVKACHSDHDAIGVIIESDGRKYYVTGDTLYNTDVLADLPGDIDVVFLPVNGKGNNMNMEDAARFARECGAKTAVPLHVGMFDEMTADAFPFEPKFVPTIYKEVIV